MRDLTLFLLVLMNEISNGLTQQHQNCKPRVSEIEGLATGDPVSDSLFISQRNVASQQRVAQTNFFVTRADSTRNM
jgi:hypothetical protein